ncbi:MAG: ATP-binding protein [Calditrichia bacterium]
MKSLGFKIGLGYAIIIAINLVLAIFAVYYINQLGSPVDTILRENYRNVNAPSNMREALKKQELAQYDMVESGFDSSGIERFITFQNEFHNWHQRAIEAIALPREPALLDSIKNVYALYLIKSRLLQQKLQESEPPSAIILLQEDSIFPLVTRIEQLCNNLQRVNEQAIEQADTRSDQISNRATTFIISVALFAIVASILISMQFMQSILKPIRETTETVRQIGQGNLNTKVAISTNDEIGELGREFNKMTERLETYERMNINRVLLEKKKSEAIVSEIPVAIFVTDEHNQLSHMNLRAQQLLEIEGNWQGKQIGQIINEPALLDLLKKHDSSLQAQGNKQLVTLQREPEELHLWLRRIQIDDPETSSLIGTVTLLQDVTSFKNLDRLKSEFMAVISHEIRTPLTSIHLALDILLREVKGAINNAQQELLSDARSDSERLKTLVKDLLDLSKLESGSLGMSFEQTDMSEFIEQAVLPLRFVLEQRKISLNIMIGKHLLPMSVDRHHLARALLNLVENAIEHSPNDSSIGVTVTQTDETGVFQINDSGAGIPEEAVDLIFDKFIQVKSFGDSETGNIGLGLAIAREVIRAHAGSIWVTSELGEGSRFFFEIPIQQVDN